MFNSTVIEKLEYYVYFLEDPRTDEVFYVGKGFGNRIFHHVSGALETGVNSDKLNRIRDIINSGHEVNHYILRHGLKEAVAFELEAAFIDLIGTENLSNLQSGHYSGDFGLKTPAEIVAMYEAEELSTTEPVLLFNINRFYRREMTTWEIYDATRKSWILGSRREQVKYGIAVYRGLTREIYEIRKWFPVSSNGRTRWGFKGRRANERIREELKYKSIKSYFRRGATNPVKYLNC
jgi:hypothetical protein